MKMLEMAGPEAFRGDVLHRIFQIGRLQLVYLALRLRKSYIFGEEKWRMIPFEGRVKTAVDRTADVFVQLPGLLSQLDLRNTRSDNSSNFELERKSMRLKAQLDGIRFAMSPLKKDRFGNDEAAENCPGTAVLSKTERYRVKHYNTELPNSTVMEKELRETAQIILLSEITELRGDRHFHYHSEMIDLCASILDQALLIKEQSICNIHLRSLFSLKVVANCSPSLKQREEAVTILQRWKVLIGAGLIRASIGDSLYWSPFGNTPSKR